MENDMYILLSVVQEPEYSPYYPIAMVLVIGAVLYLVHRICVESEKKQNEYDARAEEFKKKNPGKKVPFDSPKEKRRKTVIEHAKRSLKLK
jgi:hypothetical protein